MQTIIFCCSVTQQCPALWPCGQHAMLPCPSLSPGVCSNSSPESRWCHPTTLSSVVPFCLLTFPASWSLPKSWLLESGGWSIGASASASVLLKNIQGLISFKIDWFDLPWNSHESSPAPQFESTYSLDSAFFMGQLSHLYMTTGKTFKTFILYSFDYIELCQQGDVSAF